MVPNVDNSRRQTNKHAPPCPTLGISSGQDAAGTPEIAPCRFRPCVGKGLPRARPPLDEFRHEIAPLP